VTTDEIVAITMPKWGMAMEEGTVVGWHVAPGDPVATGDEILDIESNKATGSIDAKASGLLRRQLAAVGDIVPVGAVLGVIAGADVDDEAINAFLETLVVAAKKGEAAVVLRHRKLVLGGRELNYADEGAGDTPVMLIHGFGGSIDSWTYNRATLAESFRVISLDLPGHGESEDRGESTAVALAETVLAFMDGLGLDSAHLVAHSMGGSVAMAIAACQRERLRTLTLIASTGLGPEIDGAFIADFIAAKRRRDLRAAVGKLFVDQSLVSDRMLEEIIRMKRIDGVEAALARLAAAQFPRGVQAQSRFRELLKDADLPYQVIWGAEDSIVPAAHAAGLANASILPGAGHMPQMERWAEVNALIESFVRGR